MPVLLGKNQKANLKDTDEKRKWYPYVKTTGTLTEKEVARQIAARTTLNPKEAEMAIEIFKEVLIENIREGKNVMLGELGHFYPTVTCKPSDTEEEVNASKVKQLKFHFKPRKGIEKELQDATFCFISELAKHDK